MKKTLKHLCLAGIMAIMGSIYVNAQNPLWTFPGDYLLFDGPPDTQPLPIPPGASPGDEYTGQPAEFTHNAMPGPNGDPLFFIVDGVILKPPFGRLFFCSNQRK